MILVKKTFFQLSFNLTKNYFRNQRSLDLKFITLDVDLESRIWNLDWDAEFLL